MLERKTRQEPATSQPDRQLFFAVLAWSQNLRGWSRRNPFPEDDLPFPESEAGVHCAQSPRRLKGHAWRRRARIACWLTSLGSGDLVQSSSKDTQVDLSPPEDDAKAHPQSSVAVADAEADALSGSGSQRVPYLGSA